MEYKDYVDKMPDDIVKKLNNEYSRRVDVLEVDNISINKYLCNIYSLLSKSSAYFNYYNNDKIKINESIDSNNKHKDIIKSMHCCDDYGIYDGYLVPRYLNMDRCYHNHYCCEMDILKILLLLLGLKGLKDRDLLCKMATERIEIINTLVLQG